MASWNPLSQEASLYAAPSPQSALGLTDIFLLLCVHMSDFLSGNQVFSARSYAFVGLFLSGTVRGKWGTFGPTGVPSLHV